MYYKWTVTPIYANAYHQPQLLFFFNWPILL